MNPWDQAFLVASIGLVVRLVGARWLAEDAFIGVIL